MPPDAEPLGEPGAPERRHTLRAKVSEVILDAAASVLAKEGADASMASIANAAGVARATLYRYFPTRTELLEHLRDTVVARIAGELEAAKLDAGSSRRAIERSSRALLAGGDAFAVVAANEFLGRSDAFERQVADPLRRVFERGQERGDLRDDVSPRFMAEALIGLVAGVYRLSDAVGREDLVAGVADVFTDGVRGKHRRTSASR